MKQIKTVVPEALNFIRVGFQKRSHKSACYKGVEQTLADWYQEFHEYGGLVGWDQASQITERVANLGGLHYE